LVRAAASLALALVATLTACNAPSPAAPPGGPSPTQPLPVGAGLTVDRERREVVVDAEVACNRGWLEQAACRAGTREHESLLAIQNPPSTIHACGGYLVAQFIEHSNSHQKMLRRSGKHDVVNQCLRIL
jgi:hypothetical protein